MRVIYTPVDNDLLEHNRYYWCDNWNGRGTPAIVRVFRNTWKSGMWVITDGNEHTEWYLYDDPTKGDACYLKLVGPIELPEELK